MAQTKKALEKPVYLGYIKYIPQVEHRLKGFHYLSSNGTISRMNYTLKIADISEVEQSVFKCVTSDAT